MYIPILPDVTISLTCLLHILITVRVHKYMTLRSLEILAVVHIGCTKKHLHFKLGLRQVKLAVGQVKRGNHLNQGKFHPKSLR